MMTELVDVPLVESTELIDMEKLVKEIKSTLGWC